MKPFRLARTIRAGQAPILVAILLLVGCGGANNSLAPPPVFSNSNITITSYSPTTVTDGFGSGITVVGTNFLNVELAPNKYGKVDGAGYVRTTNGVPYGAGIPATLYSDAPPTSTTATIIYEDLLFPGTYDLYLISSNGASGPVVNTLVGPITVQPAPLPSVQSVGPNFGPPSGGNTVTIQGTNFYLVQKVLFSNIVSHATGSATNVIATSNSTLTATVPAGTGVAEISVQTQAGTSVVSAGPLYTYVASGPFVSGVSPSSVMAGILSSLTISGTGFTGATAVNLVSGSTSVPAAQFAVVSDTSISFEVPTTLMSGTYNVVVTTPIGTSAITTADQLTLTF